MDGARATGTRTTSYRVAGSGDARRGGARALRPSRWAARPHVRLRSRRGAGRSGHRSVNRFPARAGGKPAAGATRMGRIRLPEGRPAGRRVAGRDATSARVSRSSYRVGALVKEVKERSGPGLTFGTVASSADLSSSPRASSRDGDDDGGGFLGDGVGLDRAGASSSAASSSTPSGNRPSGRSPRSSSSPSRGAPAAEEVMPAGGQSSGNNN